MKRNNKLIINIVVVIDIILTFYDISHFKLTAKFTARGRHFVSLRHVARYLAAYWPFR